MVAASLLPIFCAMLAKALGRFTREDNADPRRFLAQLDGMAGRAHAAQQNGFETLPFFLASVLMAQLMVVPQYSISKLAWMYVICRVAYCFAYLWNLPSLRSCLWLLSMACPCLLFWLCIRI